MYYIIYSLLNYIIGIFSETCGKRGNRCYRAYQKSACRSNEIEANNENRSEIFDYATCIYFIDAAVNSLVKKTRASLNSFREQ